MIWNQVKVEETYRFIASIYVPGTGGVDIYRKKISPVPLNAMGTALIVYGPELYQSDWFVVLPGKGYRNRRRREVCNFLEWYFRNQTKE